MNRLDKYLQEQGLAPSRERGQAMIRSGIIYLNGVPALKPSTPVGETDQVEIRGADIPYVSRGGLKLEKAFSCFPLELHGKVCMDIGASTGGFTDCMLQNGAALVYAVDVGHDQLDARLAADSRVVNLEKTNIRALTRQQLTQPVQFFSVDVSFISLQYIFPVAFEVSTADCTGVCLVKPQFEAGREKVGKKGVVKDADTHKKVILQCIAAANRSGFCAQGLSWSPIRGPEGNLEFLLYVTKAHSENTVTAAEIDAVVMKAHKMS